MVHLSIKLRTQNALARIVTQWWMSQKEQSCTIKGSPLSTQFVTHTHIHIRMHLYYFDITAFAILWRASARNHRKQHSNQHWKAKLINVLTLWKAGMNIVKTTADNAKNTIRHRAGFRSSGAFVNSFLTFTGNYNQLETFTSESRKNLCKRSLLHWHLQQCFCTSCLKGRQKLKTKSTTSKVSKSVNSLI